MSARLTDEELINVEHWAAKTPMPDDTTLAMVRELIDRRRADLERERHPMAPDRCPDCEWSNTNLMNYGEPGRGLWLCHGCAARRIRRAGLTSEERDALAFARHQVNGHMPVFASESRSRCLAALAALDKLLGEGPR